MTLFEGFRCRALAAIVVALTLLAAGALASAEAQGRKHHQHSSVSPPVLTEFKLGGGSNGQYANREPWGIARGSDGNMWFAVGGAYGDASHAAIGRITASGGLRFFADPSHGALGGVAVGADGDIWFTSGGGDDPTAPGGLADHIGRITPAGQITEFLAGGVGPAESGAIKSIANGPGGEMWFTAGSTVGRIGESGAVTTFQLPSPRVPVDLVGGPDGNVWFTVVLSVDHPAPNEIGRITPLGQLSLFRIPTFNAAPAGIAVGPDKNIWFAEGVGKIGRITTSGKFKEFSTHLPGSEIAEIVAGPGRNLWFTDRGRNAIGKITLSGKVTEFRVPTQNRGYGFFGLAAGVDRTLWFTEARAGKIGRLKVP